MALGGGNAAGLGAADAEAWLWSVANLSRTPALAAQLEETSASRIVVAMLRNNKSSPKVCILAGVALAHLMDAVPSRGRGLSKKQQLVHDGALIMLVEAIEMHTVGRRPLPPRWTPCCWLRLGAVALLRMEARLPQVLPYVTSTLMDALSCIVGQAGTLPVRGERSRQQERPRTMLVAAAATARAPQVALQLIDSPNYNVTASAMGLLAACAPAPWVLEEKSQVVRQLTSAAEFHNGREEVLMAGSRAMVALVRQSPQLRRELLDYRAQDWVAAALMRQEDEITPWVQHELEAAAHALMW